MKGPIRNFQVQNTSEYLEEVGLVPSSDRTSKTVDNTNSPGHSKMNNSYPLNNIIIHTIQKVNTVLPKLSHAVKVIHSIQ